MSQSYFHSLLFRPMYSSYTSTQIGSRFTAESRRIAPRLAECGPQAGSFPRPFVGDPIIVLSWLLQNDVPYGGIWGFSSHILVSFTFTVSVSLGLRQFLLGSYVGKSYTHMSSPQVMLAKAPCIEKANSKSTSVWILARIYCCPSRMSLTCHQVIGFLEVCFYIEVPYCVSAAGSLGIQQWQ